MKQKECIMSVQGVSSNSNLYQNYLKHKIENPNKNAVSNNEIDNNSKEFVIQTYDNGAVKCLEHGKLIEEDRDNNGYAEFHADIDNLVPFHSNGYFQPMEEFIDTFDGITGEEKYSLKREVLTSMENANFYICGADDEIRLANYKAEMSMIANTVVPEKYRSQFRENTN